ncbi:DNA-binding transcriptional regulator, CsgD family [Izhakiella capsodis]|uniref:DNA-binding transcriptional regulator, CsgD family n=1 Tax=Izhakiella capsodis TaxID=1367852 RepID=A0A1I5A1H6_9GAMM|nr:DNA-binding transcriptional regulator, CsgD family [Izhakiella capsodis]
MPLVIMLEIILKTDNNFLKIGLCEIISQVFHEDDFVKGIGPCNYEIRHCNDTKIYIYDDVAIIATRTQGETLSNNENSFERNIFIRNNKSDNELNIVENLLLDATKKIDVFFHKDVCNFHNKENLHRKKFHKLSLREKITFVQTGQGLTNEQIAITLGCSEKSIYNYKKKLITKHHLRSKHHFYRVATCINQNPSLQRYSCWVIYNINFFSKRTHRYA